MDELLNLGLSADIVTAYAPLHGIAFGKAASHRIRSGGSRVFVKVGAVRVVRGRSQGLVERTVTMLRLDASHATMLRTMAAVAGAARDLRRRKRNMLVISTP